MGAIVLHVVAGCGQFDHARTAKAREAAQVLRILRRELLPHLAFVGNSIALSEDVVWMSAHAGRALTANSRKALAAAGFAVRTVELDAIEAGGGSLRCCIGEIF